VRRTSTRGDRRKRADRFIQSPWRVVKNRLPPIEIISADQVESIHQHSLNLLRDIGIRIDSAEARSILRENHCSVDESNRMVKFEPEVIDEMLQLLPNKFSVRARDPKKNLTLGGNNIVYCSTTGPAFASDLDRGRRPGNYQDMCSFIKLVHSANIIHHEGGNGIEPLELPVQTRYLDMMLAQCTLTDKTWHPLWKNTQARALDVCEMSRISLGSTRTEMEQYPGLVVGITMNTPLVLDEEIADGLMEFARWGQPCGIASFPLAGSMAPATMAGSLIIQNAEVLAGFMLVQSVRPGCPVLYGNFSTNVDLKSGAPAFGTPEHAKGAQAAAQMARRYGVPFRSSNTSGSNAADGQAVYENMMSLWGTVMGHTNLVRHAAGWLEGGLTCSFEKFILDVEMLQSMTEYLQPLVIDATTFDLDVVRDVGPGGHFLGSPDTMRRYKDAFYQPILSDWQTFEAWTESGSKSATQRANEVWKRLLQEYEKPYMDESIEEELTSYVARRKTEIMGN